MQKVISVIGYLTMVGGLLGLVLTRNLLVANPVVIAVQVAAAALLIWARIAFGRRSFHCAANPTEGGLVTTGPYRFIRHPIYTAVCLFATAGVVAHVSIIGLLLLGLIWIGAFTRMVCEEILVVQKYPEYLEYAARTACMIPFVF